MGTIRENLQSNLITLLDKNNVTQKQLAEQLNVTQAAVTNWVKGKNSPDIELIAQLCTIFNVSINDLINLPEQRKNIKEARLLYNFNQLNEAGKDRLISLSDDLVGNKRYTENEYKKEKRA